MVPTGNFGDILAGYYAKRMGLPMGKLVVATNANDILARFWKSRRYEKFDSGELPAKDDEQAIDASGVKETLSPATDSFPATLKDCYGILHLRLLSADRKKKEELVHLRLLMAG